MVSERRIYCPFGPTEGYHREWTPENGWRLIKIVCREKPPIALCERLKRRGRFGWKWNTLLENYDFFLTKNDGRLVTFSSYDFVKENMKRWLKTHHKVMKIYCLVRGLVITGLFYRRD